MNHETVTDLVHDTKPLFISGMVFFLDNINEVLGTVGAAISITYTAWRFYKDIKKKR